MDRNLIENALSKPNQRISFEIAPPEGLVPPSVQCAFEFLVNEKAKSSICIELEERNRVADPKTNKRRNRMTGRHFPHLS